jgi:PilZ domain
MMRRTGRRVDTGALTLTAKPPLTIGRYGGDMFDSILNHFTSAWSASGAAADRRGRERREAVAWAAELERDGKRVPIEVGNISSGGLMASVDGVLASEAPLVVWVDGRRLTGEVRWYGDGRFGMRFDTPIAIDQAVVERYRPAAVEQTKQMSRWMV